MIDTDEYEGHTEGKWRWYEGARHKTLIGVMLFGEDGNNVHPKPADAALIADAPLLLAEVERLRMLNNYLSNQLKDAKDVISCAIKMSSDDDLTMVFEDYLEVIE